MLDRYIASSVYKEKKMGAFSCTTLLFCWFCHQQQQLHNDRSKLFKPMRQKKKKMFSGCLLKPNRNSQQRPPLSIIWCGENVCMCVCARVCPCVCVCMHSVKSINKNTPTITPKQRTATGTRRKIGKSVRMNKREQRTGFFRLLSSESRRGGKGGIN